MTESSAKEMGARLIGLGLITLATLNEVFETEPIATADDLLNLFEKRSILTSYQISKLKKGDTSGFFIGRFKVLYKIASGGFARVFRAVDPTNNEVVAIKVLRDRFSLETESVRQFQREANVTKSLQHVNITRTVEVGCDTNTGQHYIAMEFIEGGNFREFMRIRKKIEPLEMIRFGKEMAEGLKHALSRGVTHRDIRMKNVLISTNGQVKWVDFGLAGVAERDASKGISVNSEPRTVEYAALEKTTGVRKGDPRSDIFFLGTVFYQMLMGEPPIVENRTHRGAPYRPDFSRIPKLAENKAVPPELGRLVDKMMELNTSNRYQDYDALLRDLTAIEKQMTMGAGVKETPRVIVVHQSSKVQQILREILSKHGVQVVLTIDIERAISLFNLKPANCFIIDVGTIGKDGLKSIDRLFQKSTATDCSAIFLAEKPELAWTEKVNCPRSVILEKPVTTRPVIEALHHFGLVAS